MCGINLILSKKEKLAESTIRQMTAATRHRGPDATAYRIWDYGPGSIGFGHNRLKIIDTSDAANQPFVSDDGRYVLLYNGEIYNFRELRQELQQHGCTFRTQSDTEVLLQLLIREGQPGLTQLNGMFALAFYDTRAQSLWLARDRFGMKPLYYGETPDFFLVSSEIKAILQTGLLKKELNQHQLEHYLCYRHAAKPQTFFKNLLELPEGTVLQYHNGKSTLHSYLAPPDPLIKIGNREQIINDITQILTDSVQQHLVADVPVGLFLSGGIDSTLMLALLQKAGHRHFPAFTIAHKTSEGSFGTEDTRFARLAAQQYQANHTCLEIDDSLLAFTDAFVQGLDQPIADGAALLTAYLAQQVKPFIKVALSGAGADELFGGYNRHWAFYLYQRHHQPAVILKHLLNPVARLLPTGFHHPLRKQFVLARKLALKIEADPAQTFRNFTSMDPRLSDLVLAKSAPSFAAAEAVSATADWLRWCLHHDQHQYLISDVLAITDQASMQHSLEVRMPYLENQLQQYLASLESEFLFRHGQKWVLKEILARHQGQAFLRRAKEGFGMPLGNWLRRRQNQYLLAELQDKNQIIFSYINFDRTQSLLQQHRHGRQDLSTEIWALLVLAKWLHHYFS